MSEKVRSNEMTTSELAKYIEELQEDLTNRLEAESLELLSEIKEKIQQYKKSHSGLSDTDIAKKIGLDVAVKTSQVSVVQKKGGSRPPSLFCGDETLGKLTADSLSRDPWFGLLESGDIENHRVTHAQQKEDGSWLCWNSKSQIERPSWVTGKARTLSDIDWNKHLENAKKLREQKAEKVSNDY